MNDNGNNNIRDEIFTMLMKKKRSAEPVSETSNLFFDLGFNSLSLVKLILEIEKKYNISIGITEMDKCARVDCLIATVEECAAKRI